MKILINLFVFSFLFIGILFLPRIFESLTLEDSIVIMAVLFAGVMIGCSLYLWLKNRGIGFTKFSKFFKDQVYLRFIPHYSLNEVLLSYILVICYILFAYSYFIQYLSLFLDPPVAPLFFFLSLVGLYFLLKGKMYLLAKLVVIMFVFALDVFIVLGAGFDSIDFGNFDWIRLVNGMTLFLTIIMTIHFKGIKYVALSESFSKKHFIIGIVGLLVIFVGGIHLHGVIRLHLGLFWILWYAPIIDSLVQKRI